MHFIVNINSLFFYTLLFCIFSHSPLTKKRKNSVDKITKKHDPLNQIVFHSHTLKLTITPQQKYWLLFFLRVKNASHQHSQNTHNTTLFIDSFLSLYILHILIVMNHINILFHSFIVRTLSASNQSERERNP